MTYTVKDAHLLYANYPLVSLRAHCSLLFNFSPHPYTVSDRQADYYLKNKYIYAYKVKSKYLHLHPAFHLFIHPFSISFIRQGWQENWSWSQLTFGQEAGYTMGRSFAFPIYKNFRLHAHKHPSLPQSTGNFAALLKALLHPLPHPTLCDKILLPLSPAKIFSLAPLAPLHQKAAHHHHRMLTREDMRGTCLGNSFTPSEKEPIVVFLEASSLVMLVKP